MLEEELESWRLLLEEAERQGEFEMTREMTPADQGIAAVRHEAYISAEQQISYRITLLGATAAEHPYAGLLAELRKQVEQLQQAWALYRIGQLAPIPTQGEQEAQENTR